MHIQNYNTIIMSLPFKILKNGLQPCYVTLIVQIATVSKIYKQQVLQSIYVHEVTLVYD